MAEQTVDEARIHHASHLSLKPALRIDSGDTIHFDIPMAGDGQIPRGGTFADARFDFETLYNLAGPVAVAGAEPGDTLRIDILSLTPGEWGWCTILPELG